MHIGMHIAWTLHLSIQQNICICIHADFCANAWLTCWTRFVVVFRVWSLACMHRDELHGRLPLRFSVSALDATWVPWVHETVSDWQLVHLLSHPGAIMTWIFHCLYVRCVYDVSASRKEARPLLPQQRNQRIDLCFKEAFEDMLK